MPQIVPVDHQQIECTGDGDGKMIGSAGKVSKFGIPFSPRQTTSASMTADFDARCCFHNTGIAFRPVGPVHGVEPYPAIAVMLQFVHSARPGGWLLGDDWPARMNESGGRI